MDLRGQRFGRFVVIDRGAAKDGRTTWRCRCDCGQEKVVLAELLRRGDSRSCGCIVREGNHYVHGHHRYGSDGINRRTREYIAWTNAKQRCTNPNDPRYQRYGARGIAMCERWRHSFAAFLADMGRSPEGHTLERTNNDGHYEPGNCKWVPRAAQAVNKSNSRVLTHDGKTLTVSQWARVIGINEGSIRRRLERGWSIHDALTKPLGPRHFVASR